MTYTILKGFHYSFFRWPKFHRNIESLSFTAKFDPSCFCKLEGEDSADINKLYGVSFGYHHRNSFRIGWNSDGSHIDIYAYWYNHKERKYFPLGSFSNTGQISGNINFDIMFHRDLNAIDLIADCDDTRGMKMKTVYKKIQFDFTGAPKWSYFLFPYFGGNKKAPHTMKININSVKIN